MKPLFLLSLGALLFLPSCKKNNHGSNALGNIKITVIAGNNQSDTVGRVLSDSIRVSVTRSNFPFPNTFPFPNAEIEIVQPGCAYSVTTYAQTGSDGTASFPGNSTLPSDPRN